MFVHSVAGQELAVATSELQFEQVSDATLVLAVDEIFALREVAFRELILFDGRALGNHHLIAIIQQLCRLLRI